MKKIIATIIAFTLSFNFVYSQKNKLWVNTNVGIYGSLLSSTGASGEFGADYLIKNTTILFRYSRYQELQKPFSKTKTPWEKFDNYGLLIGRMYSNRWIRIGGGIGAGIISGIQRGEYIKKSSSLISSIYYYKEKEILSPTALIEFKVLVKLSNYFGINFSTITNINKHNIIGSMSIGLDARMF